MRSEHRLWVAMAVGCLLLSACRLEALAFRADNRLEIVSPEDRSKVVLPVAVRWAVREAIPEARSFVIVVDRSPPPPGEKIEHFVKDFDRCKHEALQSCLEPEFLADLGIYHTSETQITLPFVPMRTGVSKSEENRHEVTVGLLDAAGRRIGESSWTVVFDIQPGE